jgi:hypothetical protein
VFELEDFCTELAPEERERYERMLAEAAKNK